MSMAPSRLGEQVAQRARLLAPAADAESTLALSDEAPAGSSSAAVREATAAAMERHQCDHYTRRPGIAPLCRAVAGQLAIDESQVTICGSVAEARYVAVRALAPGRTVYLPTPVPALYRPAVDFAGATIHPFDPLAELPAAQGGLLIVSNPSPVTGEVAPPALLQKLAAWAVSANLAVVADESVGPVRPDVAFVRLATLPGMAERTLTIGSFAAVPGLAAWQVSWVAGGKEVFPPVRDLKQTITICTAAASQYAALAAVQGSDSDEDSYAVGQAALLALLKRHSVACHRPDSLAFVVAQGVDSARLTAACRSAGLLVRDGAALGNPGTVRIAVPLEERANALAALDRGLHAYKGA